MCQSQLFATDSVPLHPFERAGLGKSPFHYVGAGKAAGYSACDYCGTGIVNEFYVGSSDGRTFKVGCECIRKVDTGGLAADVKFIVRERQRFQRRYGTKLPKPKPAPAARLF